MPPTPDIRLGTAGWSIPSAVASSFPDEGAHLQRYSRIFAAAEINSSFHRPHRTSTYGRWAASVPERFRFSAKLPKAITHARKLVEVDEPLAAFAAEIAGLGDKLAIILVQLPPSLAFDAAIADRFFAALACRIPALVACEPRHASWFTPDANAFLLHHRVARVAAHPVLVPGGEEPGGWPGLRYHRLHGAPRVYYSSYSDGELTALAATLGAGDPAIPRWCVFDNTASGAAAADALRLRSLLQERIPLPKPR